MNNVTIFDNGACFMLCVNGLMTYGFSTLGDAWRHIAWIYRVAQQQFTVGKSHTPVKQWLDGMIMAGYLDADDGFRQ